MDITRGPDRPWSRSFMKILLVQPPIEDFYTTPIRLYPLGLLYAARVLEEGGATVGLLDCLAPLKKRMSRREFGLPIFIGGNHATVFAAEIRRRTPVIDFVVEGPAEDCLPLFLTG